MIHYAERCKALGPKEICGSACSGPEEVNFNKGKGSGSGCGFGGLHVKCHSDHVVIDDFSHPVTCLSQRH